ncbi:ATP-binding cassette domain-containing protein [Noviherbaspirillum galbum]|uniref:ATP-binding cassette domain-containing protein n=1 Tax=Noviherbaspirillum galbum TaxID=2709383 RepID=A0A6B3SMB0_9BURK|nr:ATP-binding cassette domain-containing protein [Noviherbaspirillum galbum]NEX61980.1 ATP-binding cassette domain-containing protein [Noviherbaspirillum galbum]
MHHPIEFHEVGAVVGLPGIASAAHDAGDSAGPAAEPGRGGRGGRGVAVDLRQVRKSYAGREVLKGLDLRIAPGEFVAIVGRSGCGKSTLLRLLAGLEGVSGGRVAFGEEAPEVRIMFQDSRLLPWKRVLANVGLGLPAARAGSPVAQALAKVGLAERGGEWPAVLSGGQRQRVALARALVHDPQLLLLDEPLGALDALTRIEMQQLIEDLWRERGFTAVLVTHDVQEAIALADRVILIEHGEITLDERIDLPRPRARGHASFARLEEAILSRLLLHPPSPGHAGDPDFGQGDVSLLRTVGQVAWAV